MPKAKIVRLETTRKAKQLSARDQAFARVAAHQEVLELNEANFVAPPGGGLEIFDAGRAWLHKLSATFGLPRFPESEAEVLGVYQNLMFFVIASRPTPFPREDEAWLLAGRNTIAETTPWAVDWFEAYLVQDLPAMRQAMVNNSFIEEAGRDWETTQAAIEAAGGGRGEHQSST